MFMNLIFLTRTASEDGITSHGHKHERGRINILYFKYIVFSSLIYFGGRGGGYCEFFF